MDRISTLRNIEDALSQFEDDELTLPELEREVRAVLRAYATDFQPEATAYRAHGHSAVDGLVVLATSEREAREKIAELVSGVDSFDVVPLE